VEFLFQFRAMEKELHPAIENRIYTIRGQQVMLDSDLAIMYGVETRILNQAVKRNRDRFPEFFCFQLTQSETEILKSQTVISSVEHGGRRFLGYAFTEQGVAMLSTVLRSKVAVQISIQIMQAFVVMRKTQSGLQGVLQRVEAIELKQQQTGFTLERVLQALEKDAVPRMGIFFDGQVFDAFVFFSNVISSANQTIILIDNYIDHTVLLQLAKRREGVTAVIYTAVISAGLRLDLEKHNAQYPPIEIRRIQQVHDRFLLIDGKELYHIGASIKDLGKKWFAFSRMDSLTTSVLNKLPL
jgi:hypothetical protein